MVFNIEIDAIKHPFTVKLHHEVLEPDEFLGHYPPPFF
jgi:hypothetical protein